MPSWLIGGFYAKGSSTDFTPCEVLLDVHPMHSRRQREEYGMAVFLFYYRSIVTV